ncbi:DNA-binding response regulator [Tenuifilaceae bacterium CYCD]|nr:DNA-binding response regulator [Tenuifilaceae bacterium CYCD]
MNEPVRLFLVDDHQMFIDGIKALLRNEKRFKIVDEALDGSIALEKIKNTPIDIMITDISMPGMSGTELTRTVKKEYPQIKILVLTMYNDQDVANEILMSEAEGFILKNTGKKELVAALTSIADDGTFYSREVLTNLMIKVKKDKRTEEETHNLTERELEILQLICEELSSEQIAEKLFISKRTVDTHRQHIYEKTKCKTIISLIKFALRNNLVNL